MLVLSSSRAARWPIPSAAPRRPVSHCGCPSAQRLILSPNAPLQGADGLMTIAGFGSLLSGGAGGAAQHAAACMLYCWTYVRPRKCCRSSREAQFWGRPVNKASFYITREIELCC